MLNFYEFYSFQASCLTRTAATTLGSFWWAQWSRSRGRCSTQFPASGMLSRRWGRWWKNFGEKVVRIGMREGRKVKMVIENGNEENLTLLHKGPRASPGSRTFEAAPGAGCLKPPSQVPQPTCFCQSGTLTPFSSKSPTFPWNLLQLWESAGLQAGNSPKCKSANTSGGNRTQAADRPGYFCFYFLGTNW